MIKVLKKTIEPHEMQQILEFYNSKKMENEEPLEILNRCENGFKIQISYLKNQYGDENDKIKQLRWNKGCLSPMKYISFTYKEQKLLYYALAHAIGEKNVQMI